MNVRLFARLDGEYWAKCLGKLLGQLQQHTVRVCAMGPVRLSDGPLAPYAKYFTTKLPPNEPFVNVIFGFADDFERAWTDGVVNVAIVDTSVRAPNPAELQQLQQRFNYIYYNDSTPYWLVENR